jgi:hypothetical protein
MPPWLPRARRILGVVGVAVGIIGIARGDRRVVGAGIALLALVVVLRILGHLVDRRTGAPPRD